jgi:putative ABC transport system substrate-binding protein
MISRRQFVHGAGLAGLGLLTGCGRLPGQVQQPAPRLYRLGILSGALDPPDSLVEALGELGYVQGHNLAVAYRSAEGVEDRLPDLARELLAEPVDVVVTVGLTATLAARQATDRIPIVQATATGSLPESGLIDSYARPGGNVTGLDPMAGDLAGKRLQLLKEAVPGLVQVAALVRSAAAETLRPQTEPAAEALGLTIQFVVVREPSELSRALEVAKAEGAGGLLVQGRPLVIALQDQIVSLAARHRLPAMYGSGTATAAGGLMYYGPNLADLFRRAATYVDKVLKGASPADLPVERPMRFDFVINLKPAQALGLTIPQHVLLQATEVIQ